jgi:hypothetical protein
MYIFVDISPLCGNTNLGLGMGEELANSRVELEIIRY